MPRSRAPVWALILAGGEGSRLQPFIAKITGDARPKQFCALVGGQTLLDHTRRRADLVARPDCQVVVVTRPHEPYFRALATDLAPGRLVVQPANRGTAPGIVYPLLRIRDLAGDVPVAVLPSDHQVSEDQAFTDYVNAAADIVAACPDRVVLLGIEARSPETDYGWVETSAVPLPIDGEPAFPITHFWEKPSPRVAEMLLQRGCLWNSFVMVGRVSAFLGMVRQAVPSLFARFAPILTTPGASSDPETAATVYVELEPTNFSDAVLARSAHRLAAIRVKGVGWSDLGTPERVLAVLSILGQRPPWLRRPGLAETA